MITVGTSINMSSTTGCAATGDAEYGASHVGGQAITLHQRRAISFKKLIKCYGQNSTPKASSTYNYPGNGSRESHLLSGVMFVSQRFLMKLGQTGITVIEAVIPVWTKQSARAAISPWET
jgi:hypothetical protein